MRIGNERAITVYNADKQEVVGIFSTPTLVMKYLWAKQKTKKPSYLFHYLHKKTQVKKTIFDFKVVVRYANQEQIEKLGEEDYIILNNYYEPPKVSMGGFTSPANWLSENSIEKNHRQKETNERINKK